MPPRFSFGGLNEQQRVDDKPTATKEGCYAVTPRQRRYMGALCASTALAMCAALTAGWVALAFGVGSVVVLAAAGRRRLRQCQREGV